MIAVLLLAQAVTMQTLPPPHAAAISAATFECQMIDQAGASFALRGRIPAYPAGWDPNQGQSMMLEGTGPAELRGAAEVKPFTVGREYRRYYVTARVPNAGHHNLMFVLLAGDDDGVVTVDRFVADPESGRGALKAVATGSCEARFETSAPGGAKK